MRVQTHTTALLAAFGLAALLTAAWPAASAHAIDGPAFNPPSVSNANAINTNCFSCQIFNTMKQTADNFIKKLYNGLGAQAQTPMQILAVLYLLFLAIRLGIGHADVNDVIRAVSFLIAIFIAGWFLEDYGRVKYWIVDPVEKTALSVAKFTVSQVGDKAGAHIRVSGAENGYAEMMGAVEYQFASIAKYIWENQISIWHPINTILGVLLLLPYLFVVGIFAAFMIEAMFSFVAMSLAAPLLIAAAPFPKLRPFGIAALRIMLGAGLSLIFAAAAMGVTVSVADGYRQRIDTGTSQISSEALRQSCEESKKRQGGLNGDTSECVRYKNNESAGQFDLDEDFLVFFLIGFISVLLHLKAKTLASNISGANDGAGPAAATVTAGKMALGAGAMAIGRTLTGQGGVSGLAAGAAATFPGVLGSTAHAGLRSGVVGAAGHAVAQALPSFGRVTAPEMEAMSAQTSSSGFNSSVGGGQFSVSSNKQMNLSDETIDKLAQSLGDNISNGGRNRRGSGG